MGGWSINLEGDDEISTDAEHENLRALARNVTRAAANTLHVTKSTLSPVAEGGSGDVGITYEEQVDEAAKVSDAQAKAREEEAAAVVAETNKQAAKASKAAAESK